IETPVDCLLGRDVSQMSNHAAMFEAVSLRRGCYRHVTKRSANCQKIVNNNGGHDDQIIQIPFEIAGTKVEMSSIGLIPRFVHPQLSAPIGAGRNRQVEAVVLSYLPGVRAGARANCSGNFSNPLVAVSINLLVHKNEA